MLQPPVMPGEVMVLRTTKRSPKPGPRAKDIEPDRRGDHYTYHVDKFWVVKEVDDEEVILQTRRGKVRRLHLDNPNLRRPKWWERIRFGKKFPRLHDA